MSSNEEKSSQASSELNSQRQDVDATHTPQLAHSARQMFETRLAKYNDPRNLEWDFDDITDKWQRHAYSAYLDLVAVESQRDALRSALGSIADRYHADRCPVYHFSGGKGACDCHVGIARAALSLVEGKSK